MGQAALLDLVGQAFGRACHLITAAVIQSNRQMHPVVVGRAQFQLIHQADQLVIKPNPVADKPHADALFVKLVRFTLKIPAEQAHQSGHFRLGTLPVFCRKRKYCQILDTEPRARFQNITHTPRAGMMAKQTRATALLGPTAVAIHNNGDMGRSGRGVCIFGHG